MALLWRGRSATHKKPNNKSPFLTTIKPRKKVLENTNPKTNVLDEIAESLRVIGQNLGRVAVAQEWLADCHEPHSMGPQFTPRQSITQKPTETECEIPSDLAELTVKITETVNEILDDIETLETVEAYDFDGENIKDHVRKLHKLRELKQKLESLCASL